MFVLLDDQTYVIPEHKAYQRACEQKDMLGTQTWL